MSLNSETTSTLFAFQSVCQHLLSAASVHAHSVFSNSNSAHFLPLLFHHFACHRCDSNAGIMSDFTSDEYIEGGFIGGGDFGGLQRPRSASHDPLDFSLAHGTQTLPPCLLASSRGTFGRQSALVRGTIRVGEGLRGKLVGPVVWEGARAMTPLSGDSMGQGEGKRRRGGE